MIKEDLNSSFPVVAMSESDVRSALKSIAAGGEVEIGYVSTIPLAANYANGKLDKSTGMPYPVVRAIKCTELTACVGIDYKDTDAAKMLHGTQKYQDKMTARSARGLGGFSTNVHDTEAGLSNILVTTKNGLKCIVAYPVVGKFPTNTYYLSIDSDDWQKVDKADIAQYMTASAANSFLNGNNSKAAYQARVMNDAGQNVSVSGNIIMDVNTGKEIKLNPSPMNITYLDANNPFKCVYKISPVASVAVVPSNDITGENHLDVDFPEADI